MKRLSNEAGVMIEAAVVLPTFVILISGVVYLASVINQKRPLDSLAFHATRAIVAESGLAHVAGSEIPQEKQLKLQSIFQDYVDGFELPGTVLDYELEVTYNPDSNSIITEVTGSIFANKFGSAGAWLDNAISITTEMAYLYPEPQTTTNNQEPADGSGLAEENTNTGDLIDKTPIIPPHYDPKAVCIKTQQEGLDGEILRDDNVVEMMNPLDLQNCLKGAKQEREEDTLPIFPDPEGEQTPEKTDENESKLTKVADPEIAPCEVGDDSCSNINPEVDQNFR